VKDFRRDAVHGAIERGVVGRTRDVQLSEQLLISVGKSAELSIGHARVTHECQQDNESGEGIDTRTAGVVRWKRQGSTKAHKEGGNNVIVVDDCHIIGLVVGQGHG
jgi:hypothetical protein